MAKIVITGGSGFLGRKLIQALLQKHHEVIVFTRTTATDNVHLHPQLKYKTWNPLSGDKEWIQWIDGADAVIHLAGAPVVERWTKKHKQAIMDSRSLITRYISESINNAVLPPKFFFSASAIGYYGNTGDENCTEDYQPSVDGDFLSDVCKKWEESARIAEEKTRLIIGRIGIVLDRNEGALAKMLPTFRLGLGGILGKGNQWWSWIHYKDVIGIILWAMESEGVKGIVNITSPNPITMKSFAKTLGIVLHRPVLFSIPQLLLSVLMGENSIIATHSQKVIPNYTQQKGYEFRFPILEQSLRDILKD